MPKRPLHIRIGWTLRDYAKRVWDNSGEDNIFFLAGGIAFNILLAAVPFVLLFASGLGYLLNQQGKFHTLAEFWPIFIPSLTGMIGFWATLSLNMPDFTRFGKSQRDQVVGQVVALPSTMTVFAAMGVMITSAAVVSLSASRVRAPRAPWSRRSGSARCPGGRHSHFHSA